MKKISIIFNLCLLWSQVESDNLKQNFTFPKMKSDVDPSMSYWKYVDHSNQHIYQSIYSKTLYRLKKEARLVADKSYFSFWSFYLKTGDHSFQTDTSFIFINLKESAYDYAKKSANSGYLDEINRLKKNSTRISRGPLKGRYFVPGFDKPLSKGFWNDDNFKRQVKQELEDAIINDITKRFPLGGKWEYPRRFYNYKPKCYPLDYVIQITEKGIIRLYNSSEIITKGFLSIISKDSSKIIFENPEYNGYIKKIKKSDGRFINYETQIFLKNPCGEFDLLNLKEPKYDYDTNPKDFFEKFYDKGVFVKIASKIEKPIFINFFSAPSNKKITINNFDYDIFPIIYLDYYDTGNGWSYKLVKSVGYIEPYFAYENDTNYLISILSKDLVEKHKLGNFYEEIDINQNTILNKTGNGVRWNWENTQYFQDQIYDKELHGQLDNYPSISNIVLKKIKRDVLYSLKYGFFITEKKMTQKDINKLDKPYLIQKLIYDPSGFFWDFVTPFVLVSLALILN